MQQLHLLATILTYNIHITYKYKLCILILDHIGIILNIQCVCIYIYICENIKQYVCMHVLDPI